LASAQELVKFAPEDGRSWTFLAEQLDGNEAEHARRADALERAARLSPDDAEALNNLAWEKVTHGDPATGLKLASRATHIVPWSSAMLDTLAAALFKLGRCPEARDIEQRAVSLLHDQISDDTRRQLLGALMQYQRKCPAVTDR
jgi:Flp pilus assembly protein TadD